MNERERDERGDGIHHEYQIKHQSTKKINQLFPSQPCYESVQSSVGILKWHDLSQVMLPNQQIIRCIQPTVEHPTHSNHDGLGKHFLFPRLKSNMDQIDRSGYKLNAAQYSAEHRSK